MWLMDEISLFNVQVKRRCFPKEASNNLRKALENTLSLALSLHKNSPLSFAAYSLFVLFPRRMLRPLPDGCQGSFAAAALNRRCSLLSEVNVACLIQEAHDSHLSRLARQAASASESVTTFSKAAKAVALAGVGEVGRSCKAVFTYGLETDPEVAACFLAKLTLQQRHAHIVVHVSTVKPSSNKVPLKAITEAFAGMPKKSVAHRDGWTWEFLRDAASTDSTASLLRQFSERFSNGELPKDLWAYLASALVYPFHKKLPEERVLLHPALRPVTVGSVLTRFGCRVLVRMGRHAVVAELLLSHQFSFGVNGGVQQFTLACTIAL